MSIIIDGHVHIQPNFDLDVFLDNAWNNLSKVSHELGAEQDDCFFVLLLTEAQGCDVFSSLVQKVKSGHDCSDRQWHYKNTQETNSLTAVKGTKRISLIAGRQLVSRENIELLSFFSPLSVENKSLSLDKLAQWVTENGALPLIPWGVGKWLGNRGKVVAAFLDSPPVPIFLVGDNGNRPNIWPYPHLLGLAEKKGVLSLAGSDPLKFVHHVGRAGIRGGILPDEIINRERPAEDLQRLLRVGPRIQSYGRGVGFFQFFRDQLKANMKKKG